ncbi:MAG: alpha-L-arabinofuranosidase [Acidobacteria bacterium]|nr:alpha-L-arabinofuranosidase [Acidobacteriota bacterium]
MTTRRTALRQLAVGLLAARSSRAAEASVNIRIDEPIGPIAPALYGHFTEHIGGVIYGGVWVGENSSIPNEHGLRKRLLDSLRLLRPPVIRWPGGCFADSYDWRDGVGPRAKRPRRLNFWQTDPQLAKAPDGPQKYEPNEFGTAEFMRFVRAVGAEPYFAANVRSLTPRDFHEWIDYCNTPAGKTTLADQRAASGDVEPYRVRYWGVGNESWGCGGDLTPDEYAMEFRRFTSYIPKFDAPLNLIAAGPNGGDLNWTRRFFANLAEKSPGLLNRVWGWALHYYCGTAGKGQALDFDVADWYALLGKASRMEDLIVQHWAAMGEIDARHRVKLVVDEWGAWHRAGSEVDPAYLFGQTPTLRDALISALTLDIFQRHADKVAMANVAQLVNNLHALFLAREDKFTETPNYHVFRMYMPHAGATSVRADFSAPQAAGMWRLAGSASIRGRQLTLTAVNSHATEECAAAIAIPGYKVASASSTTLASTDLRAHNSFEAPRRLEPRTAPAELASGVYRFPPASVTRLDITLA